MSSARVTAASVHQTNNEWQCGQSMAALLIAQNGIGNLSAGDALGNLPRDLTEPQSLEAVEFATLEWVDWFNNRRLLEPIGGIPPAEAEARYYAQLEHAAMAA